MAYEQEPAEDIITDESAEAYEPGEQAYIPPRAPVFPAISPIATHQAGAVAGGMLSGISNRMGLSPTREANGDDLSDLFEGVDDEDLDVNIDDLVDVDEEDIFGEGGEDMSDLIDVSFEDIMGEPPKPRMQRVSRRNQLLHQYSPGGMTGVEM